MCCLFLYGLLLMFVFVVVDDSFVVVGVVVCMFYADVVGFLFSFQSFE